MGSRLSGSCTQKRATSADSSVHGGTTMKWTLTYQSLACKKQRIRPLCVAVRSHIKVRVYLDLSEWQKGQLRGLTTKLPQGQEPYLATQETSVTGHGQSASTPARHRHRAPSVCDPRSNHTGPSAAPSDDGSGSAGAPSGTACKADISCRVTGVSMMPKSRNRGQPCAPRALSATVQFFPCLDADVGDRDLCIRFEGTGTQTGT